MLVGAAPRGAVSARVNAGTETESARSNPDIAEQNATNYDASGGGGWGGEVREAVPIGFEASTRRKMGQRNVSRELHESGVPETCQTIRARSQLVRLQ